MLCFRKTTSIPEDGSYWAAGARLATIEANCLQIAGDPKGTTVVYCTVPYIAGCPLLTSSRSRAKLPCWAFGLTTIVSCIYFVPFLSLFNYYTGTERHQSSRS